MALGLEPSESSLYYVFLRLRASGGIAERPIKVTANGDLVWQGSLGSRSRDIVMRIRRRVSSSTGWRLRIRASINMTRQLRDEIFGLDSRVPTIGFERLIVIPENDLKTRLDVMYSLLL